MIFSHFFIFILSHLPILKGSHCFSSFFMPSFSSVQKGFPIIDFLFERFLFFIPFICILFYNAIIVNDSAYLLQPKNYLLNEEFFHTAFEDDFSHHLKVDITFVNPDAFI